MSDKFLWGHSVSSMQMDGAWDEDGKGMSIYDIKKATPDASDWKVGIDHYHRYLEDFDLMKEMGMNAYRFQISWSRVFPNGKGELNEKALEFYDAYIDELLKREIEPIICLYHFDMPLELAREYEGFLSREVVSYFVRYAKLVIDRYKDKVKKWLVFNEQNLFHDPTAGLYAGCLRSELSEEEVVSIYHNAMIAYSQIANYVHEFTTCQIGGMVMYVEIYPETSDPKDVFYARKADEFLNQNPMSVFATGKYSSEVQAYLKAKGIMTTFQEEDLELIASAHSDFLAFSYYNSVVISHKKIEEDTAPFQYVIQGEVKNKYTPTTYWDWNIDPLGFRNVMNKLYQRYHIPLFPVENGIGAIEEWDEKTMIEDDYRIEYHHDHIEAMSQAIQEDGIEVIGYLGWGLIDIPSSQGDMRKRYGAVYVNRENHDLKDMKRVKKKSFSWFQSVFK